MIEELSCENIFLGELKHGGVIEKKEHWEVDATNCAAIYATKVPQDLKNKEVVITDILGNEILRSNFIEVPQGKYQNSNLEEIAYIVKTPINKKSEAFHGQVCFFDKSIFADTFKITNKTPAGITAPIVMHIASLQANLALRYLAGFNVKKDYLYYLFFNDDGELITQKFNLPK